MTDPVKDDVIRNGCFNIVDHMKLNDLSFFCKGFLEAPLSMY